MTGITIIGFDTAPFIYLRVVRGKTFHDTAAYAKNGSIVLIHLGQTRTGIMALGFDTAPFARVKTMNRYDR